MRTRGTPRSRGDLRAHDCVTFEVLMAPEAWALAIGRADVSVPIHSRLVINTADAAIAGIGNHARALVPDRDCDTRGYDRDRAPGIRADVLAD
jgi:hypothetical protein